MTHTVKLPFKTPTRRFAEGQAVAPADISGPVTFEAWKTKGFIAEEQGESAEPAPTKGRKAPAA